MLSFSTPLARELRRALSPGFLCCRNSDVTVVIRRKVVGIDLHIWRPEKFYNSVTLFAVRPIIYFIIHSKYFPDFDWLKAHVIHHNQLLMTKFGRIFRLMNRWHQKCSVLAGWGTVNWEDLGTRLNCFGCENKNGGTFYLFDDDLLFLATRWIKSAMRSTFADLNSS